LNRTRAEPPCGAQCSRQTSRQPQTRAQSQRRASPTRPRHAPASSATLAPPRSRPPPREGGAPGQDDSPAPPQPHEEPPQDAHNMHEHAARRASRSRSPHHGGTLAGVTCHHHCHRSRV